MRNLGLEEGSADHPFCLCLQFPALKGGWCLRAPHVTAYTHRGFSRARQCHPAEGRGPQCATWLPSTIFFCDTEPLKASPACGWRCEIGVQSLRGANNSQGELDPDNGCLGHMREEFGQVGCKYFGLDLNIIICFWILCTPLGRFLLCLGAMGHRWLAEPFSLSSGVRVCHAVLSWGFPGTLH